MVSMSSQEQLVGIEKFVKTSFGGELVEEVRWNSEGSPRLRKMFPDLTILGAGHESLVIIDPQDPENVLSFSRRNLYCKAGVMPFAEAYNIHAMLSILFPDNLPRIRKIHGLNDRNSKREYVEKGKNSFNLNIDDFQSLGVSMNEQLKRMGITAMFDTFHKNYAIDKFEKLKYLDLPNENIRGFENVDLSLVKKRIDGVYKGETLEIKDKKYQIFLSYLRRLKELEVTNVILESVVKKGDYLDESWRQEVNLFSFSKDVDENKDLVSKKRIVLVLEKALQAIRSGKYKYKDNAWCDFENE